MVTIRAAAAGGGIVEGDYNTWTLKWRNDVPDGVLGETMITLEINDTDELLYLAWNDKHDIISRDRFSIRKLSDFSSVFTSPSGEYYRASYIYNGYKRVFDRGFVSLYHGALSISLDTYQLLARWDLKTIEVWRGDNASKLWSRDISGDFNNYDSEPRGMISLTGKWIIIVNYQNEVGEITCYEGT